MKKKNNNNKMAVRPAKTQISLSIRPVWSDSSLSAWKKFGSLSTHWAHRENSDHTGRMPRLIWVFAGRTLILLVLSCRGSCKFSLSDPKYLDRQVCRDHDDPAWGSSLIGVYSVCRVVWIVLTHHPSMVKPHYWNSRIFTAIFRLSDFFQIFVVNQFPLICW